MSDRQRTEVPVELLALYEAEKARPDPTSGDRDAVFTALAASCGFAAVAAGVAAVGTGAAAGSSGTAAASTGVTVASTGATVASTAGISSSLPALLLKPVTLLVFAAGAATGTGTTLLVDHVTSPEAAPTRTVARRAPAAPRVEVPSPSELRPPTPKAPPVAVLQPIPPGEASKGLSEPPRPAGKRIAPRRPHTHRAQRSPSANTSVVERNLLERARTALSRGESTAALRALQQHHKRYPRGILAEERGALMVVALAGLGKRARARAAARQFKKRYPHSLLLPLVDDALKRAADPR